MSRGAMSSGAMRSAPDTARAPHDAVVPRAAAVPRHVYVHVPFCARRCAYCDFSIAVRRRVPVGDYVRGIAAELDARGVAPSAHGKARHDIDTLYLGGGTPSALGADGVAQLLDALRRVFRPAPGAEVTLEANPEDVTRVAADAWRDAGVTRVSLGVQSFDDRVLHWMHRVHDARAVPRAVEALRAAGLEDVSIDLIFALPAALGRDWAGDLRQALALEPTHVSLYGLTVEPATPLGRWTARGSVHEAPEEAWADEFLLAHARLGAAGFAHYEVSNYGRPGYQARHNAAYWRGVPYLGLGPAAHGFDGRAERRWNLRGYVEWQAAVDAERDPVGGTERLTAADREAETVYLGLRTAEGLVERPDDAAAVAPWVAAGWIVRDAGRLRCTPQGWLRLDALAAALTASRSP